MAPDVATTSGPPWAEPIRTLRTKLHLTQAQLASELGVSGMAVSRWERGTHEPPAQYLIAMGNLVGAPECWNFWRFAGIRYDDLIRALAERPERDEKSFASSLNQASDMISVPVLKMAASADMQQTGDYVPSLEEADVEFCIGVPRWWSPENHKVVGLRVSGRAMSPLIDNGSVVAVDTSEQTKTEVRDSIVVMTRDHVGFKIGWLRDSRGEYVLMAENREFSPLLVGDPQWRVLGRVLWWITSAPE